LENGNAVRNTISSTTKWELTWMHAANRKKKLSKRTHYNYMAQLNNTWCHQSKNSTK